MTLAYWCVLAAILLPYAFTGFAKFQGGFGLNENKNPREFLEKLGGARKREGGGAGGEPCLHLHVVLPVSPTFSGTSFAGRPMRCDGSLSQRDASGKTPRSSDPAETRRSDRQ